MTRPPEPAPPEDVLDPEDDRLAYEHRQDELAREEVGVYEGVEPPPPGRRVPAVTVVLAGLLVGMLFFFAGVEAQKLLGEAAPAPVVQGGPGGDDGLVGGEVLAIRGDTLYVREGDGALRKLRTRPDSRVARGRRVDVDGIRPGQKVVVETAGAGSDAVRTLTIVPGRDRGAAGP